MPLPGELDKNNNYKNTARPLEFKMRSGPDYTQSVGLENVITYDPTQVEASDLPEGMGFGAVDTEEAQNIAGEFQGPGETILKGVGRLASSTAFKTVEGVVDLANFVVSIPQAISEGSADPMFHNVVSDYLRQSEEAVNQSLFPIYDERGDKDNNFLENLANIDYWATDIADGVAFVGSAYLTGFGMNKLLSPLVQAKYASQIAKAEQLAAGDMTVLEGLTATEQAALQNAAAVVGRNTSKLPGASKISQATVAGTARTIESIAEAGDARKTVYDEVYNRRLKEIQESDPTISQEDAMNMAHDEATDKAAKAATAVFGMNMLLMPLEYLQAGALFKTSTALSKAIKYGADKAVAKSILNQAGSSLAENMISEGIVEEGLQYGMQEYAKKMAKGEYDYSIGSALKNSVGEWFNSFATKEGWDAMGAGMIIGGIFGGAGGYRNAKANKAEVDKVVADINKGDYNLNASNAITKNEAGEYVINKAFITEAVKSSAQFKQLDEAKKKAIIENDTETYKFFDNLQFGNVAQRNLRLGTEDRLLQQIEGLGNIDEEGLRKSGLAIADLYNSKGEKVTAKQLSQRYKEKLVEYQNLFKNIEGTYALHSTSVRDQLFREAVIQDEVTKSMESVSKRMTQIKSDLLSRQQMAFGEEIEQVGAIESQELDKLNKKQDDYRKVLKESYKRVKALSEADPIKQKEAEEKKRKEAEKAFNESVKQAEKTKKEKQDFVTSHKEGDTVEFTVDGKQEEGVVIFDRNTNKKKVHSITSNNIYDLENIFDSQNRNDGAFKNFRSIPETEQISRENVLHKYKERNILSKIFKKKAEAAKLLRDKLLKDIFTTNHYIITKQNEVDKLVEEYNNGSKNITQDKLIKLLKALNKDLMKAQTWLEENEPLLTKHDNDIAFYEQQAQTATSDELNQKLKELTEERDSLEENVDIVKGLINNLKKYIRQLQSIFRKLFPNAKSDLANVIGDYPGAALRKLSTEEIDSARESKVEIESNKEALELLKRTLAQIEEEKKSVENKINNLTGIINEYNSEYSKFEFERKKAEDSAKGKSSSETEVNPIDKSAKEDRDKERDKHNEQSRKNTLFTTAGQDVQGTKIEGRWKDAEDENGNVILNENNKSFFEFSRSPQSTPAADNAISLKIELNNEWNKVNQISNDSVEETALVGIVYRNGQVVTDEQGNPVKIDLHRPSFESELVDSEQREADTNNFMTFKQEVLKKLAAGEAVYVPVSEKSKGVPNLVSKPGQRIRNKILDILFPGQKQSSVIGKLGISQVQGEFNKKPIVYINNVPFEVGSNGKVYTTIESANGTPIALQLINRTLNKDEAKLIHDMLVLLAGNQKATIKVAGKNMKVYDLLNTMVYIRETESPTALYFKEGILVYGDKAITAEDLKNGSKELEQWLLTKPHNISNLRLKDDVKNGNNGEKYYRVKSISNGEGTYEVYNSYHEYLVGGETLEGTPARKSEPVLGTDLANEPNPRFLQVYLTYSPVIQDTPGLPTAQRAAPVFAKEGEQGTEVVIGQDPFAVQTATITPAEVQGQSVGVISQDDFMSEEDFDEDMKLPVNFSFGQTPPTSSNPIKDSSLSEPEPPAPNQLFRKVTEGSYTQEDLNSAEKWFKARFPQVSITFSDLVLLMGNGTKAMGKFEDAVVTIWKNAEEGTVFHEAFHVVSQLFLTPAERAKLYKEAAQRHLAPSIEDLQELSVLYPTLSNKQLMEVYYEEKIAEDFRDYMLNKKDAPKESKNIFKRILDLIKMFIDKIAGNNKTQEVFDKINKGFYANKAIIPTNLSPTNPTFLRKLKINKNDIEMELSPEASYNIVRAIDYLFAAVLAKKGLSPSVIKAGLKDINAVYADVKAALEKDGAVDLVNNFERVKALHKYYTTSRKITFPTYESEDEVVKVEEAPTQEDYIEGEHEIEVREKDNAQGKEAAKFSSKDGTPNVIKFLLSTLPARNEKGEWIKTPIAGVNYHITDDFNRLWMILAQNLSGMTSYDQMANKMTQMLPRYPFIADLFGRIQAIQDIGEKETVKTQFFQAFAKTTNNYITVLIDKKGNIYNTNAIADTLIDKIRRNWISSFKSKEFMNYNKEELKAYFLAPKTGKLLIEDPATFLNEIGFYLSTEGINNINKLDLKRVTGNIKQYIKNELEVGTPAYEWFKGKGEKNKFKGDLRQLIELDLPYQDQVTDVQFINTEGETVYAITLNNYLSQFINDLSREDNHYVNNKYNANSKWYSVLRSNKNVKVTVIDGTKIEKGSENQKKHNSDLVKQDLIATRINNLLNSTGPIYTLLRTSDKKMEYGISGLPLLFKQEDISHTGDSIHLSDAVVDTFYGYFTDEMERIKDAKDGKLDADSIKVFNKNATKPSIFSSPVFKQAVAYALAGEEIKARANFELVIRQYFDTRLNKTIDYLVKNNVLYYNDGKLKNNGISFEILPNESDKIYEKIGLFVINDFAGNIEQTKLLFGDLAFYKDFFKRTPAAIATGKVSRVDEAINKYIKDTNYNFFKQFGDTFSKLMENGSNGIFNVATMKDVEFKSAYLNHYKSLLGVQDENDWRIKPYTQVNEADAQGFITLPAYREFMIRLGDWSKEHDNAYEKLLSGKRLGSKEMVLFQPLKPMYFGPKVGKDIFTPGYLKFSLYPIIPSFLSELSKGEINPSLVNNIEQFNYHMLKNNTSIAVFESGNKVGAEDIFSIYDADGKLNVSALENMPQTAYDYRYLRLQLDIGQKSKKRIIFGTQLRKLIFSNIFGRDVNGNRKDTSVKSYEDKYNNQMLSADDLLKEYSDVQGAIIQEAKDTLLKEVGLNEQGNIVNGRKLINIVKKEFVERGVADNMVEAIDMLYDSSNNGLKGTLDLIPNSQRLENIIMAIVNNRLIKQKMNGGSMIQVASTMFETGARKVLTQLGQDQLASLEQGKYKDVASGNLKFLRAEYTENGEVKQVLSAEILLPNRFKKKFGINDVTDITDKEVLELIGYRIPTQGVNSIVHLTVKGFLPEEAGDVVIVPSEITAQGGSDFDIDKLNLFMKNLVKDANDKMTVEKITDKENLRNNTIGALENRLIEIQTIILSSSSSVGSLITPNSADFLKRNALDIKELTKDEDMDDVNQTRLLEFDYVADIHERFLSGKAGVGITALHNAHHVLTQIADISINNATLNYKHNVNEDNKASLAGIYDIEGNNILEAISGYMNAFVDAAKDPFIFDLGFDLNTSNVGFFMLRTGASYDFVNRFLMQPIIREYLELTKVSEGLIIEKNKKSKKNDLKDLKLEKEEKIKKVIEKYESVSEEKAEAKEITKGDLNKGLEATQDIKKGKITKEVAQLQLQILNDFLNYNDYARKLGEVIKSTQDDTNGTGKNFAVADNIIGIKNKVEAEQFVTNLDKLYDLTFMKHFKDNGAVLALSLYQKVILHQLPKFKGLKQSIKGLLGNEFNIDEVVAETLDNYIKTYVTQVYLKRTLEKVKGLFTGNKSIAKHISHIKKTKDHPLHNNMVIKQMFIPRVGEEGLNNIDNLQFNNKRMDGFQSSLVTEAFNEIKVNNRALYQDLILLDVYQSGIKDTPYSYLKYIPAEDYMNMMGTVIGDMSKNIQHFDNEKFIRNFFKNNFNNNKIVPSRRMNAFVNSGGLYFVNTDKFYRLYEQKKPYVLLETEAEDILLENIGYRMTTDKNNNEIEQHIFIPVSKKGLGFKLTEISNGNTTIVESNRKDDMNYNKMVKDFNIQLSPYNLMSNRIEVVEDKLPTAPKADNTVETYKWARSSNNNYEVSSNGDKRFSALYAKLKDGRTIEEAYQLDVKGYRSKGNDWRLGKGKAPIRNISQEQSWNEYKALWEQYLNENPALERELKEKAKGKVLTDMFAYTPVSQARALAELLNERNNTLPNIETKPCS